MAAAEMFCSTVYCCVIIPTGNRSDLRERERGGEREGGVFFGDRSSLREKGGGGAYFGDRSSLKERERERERGGGYILVTEVV